MGVALVNLLLLQCPGEGQVAELLENEVRAFTRISRDRNEPVLSARDDSGISTEVWRRGFEEAL